MAYDLNRFVEAQDRDGTYGQALAELRAGRKTGHWIWFVFPQIAGLGQSPTARRYAIDSLQEARDYLSHPVLGARLVESAQAVLEHRGRTAEEILGGLDALKLRSSMTLFGRAGPEEAVFAQVLDAFFGGVPDELTNRLLGID